MHDEQQPGWTFSPGQQIVPGQVLPVDQTPQQPQTPPQEALQKNQSPLAQSQFEISWTASEFVEHEKNSSWYIGIIFVAIVGIAAVYVITRDVFSVVALSLFALAFVLFGARKPRVLNYGLSDTGLQVGDKFYHFSHFRSFAVVDEGAINSISLLPLKRFMPAINVYFAPEDEAKITKFLGLRLPGEVRRQDAVDRFMGKIRF